MGWLPSGSPARFFEGEYVKKRAAGGDSNAADVFRNRIER